MLYLMPFISMVGDYVCPRFIFSSKTESTKGRSTNKSQISWSGSPRSCSRLLQSWCLLISRRVLCLQMYSTDTSERDSKAAVVKSLREFEHSLYQFASCLLISLKTNGKESKQSIKQGGHWLLRHAVVELFTAVTAAKGLGWFLLLCMQKVWLGWGRRLEPVDKQHQRKIYNEHL